MVLYPRETNSTHDSRLLLSLFLQYANNSVIERGCDNPPSNITHFKAAPGSLFATHAFYSARAAVPLLIESSVFAVILIRIRDMPY